MFSWKSMAVSNFHFHVSVEQANLHYFKVRSQIRKKQNQVRLFLPNWTPGSYKIRNFSTHVFGVKAFSKKSKKIFIEQVDLDSWVVESKENSFILEYLVYAFENTVRTNYLTTEFGFISPPALFMYSEESIRDSVTAVSYT
ncbi:MAG: M61 family peptidase, partial [Leptospiraceae bacterium]|nr:M61 family peptidase [Leptospiraceae bacterium]